MAKPAHQQRPVALTIAGSDSGGGAGIQADLKTFAALGVHGVTAITCLTAQNPKRVKAVQPAKTAIVRAQLDSIAEGLYPAAAKTGMLYSAEIVRTVAGWIAEHPTIPLVVDPVMVSTSGAQLLTDRAISELRRSLLPKARLITPNLDEAALLAGRAKLGSAEDLRWAARQIRTQYSCAVLVKGGHLRGLKQAIDILLDDTGEYLLEAAFVRGVSTHGTGCTYSAAVTAFLARGNSLVESVRQAKQYITAAVAGSYSAREHFVLRHI